MNIQFKKQIKDFFILSYDRLFNRLSQKDKIFFVKRLSFLISSGAPLIESLEMVRDQTVSSYFKGVVIRLIEDVSNGKLLSVALERYRDQFGDFAINIIYFGESSGTLSQNLEHLVIELKKRHTLKKKIIGASIYPALVILGVFVVVGFLVIYLFPKILPVFASLRMDLPLSTRIVINVSTALRSYGWLFLVSIFVIVVGIYWALRHSRTVRMHVGAIKLRTPLIGKVTRSYNLASITRTLGLLLQAGLTLGESLAIASKITSNELYRTELKKLEVLVNQGDSLGTHLKGRPLLFPEVVAGIVAVGERSGNLPTSLLYLCELFEEEVDDVTRNISSLIEPVLMVVMGVLVGFIAISIISPIYGITSNLHPK